ncbi:hypothetical protein [Vibrio mangrovi]|uniref:Lipoprotein n=1 Tax=Vibrio mangrovi TaxID=474394 RepID=A0ABU4I9F4_9VIBR|nr:hypothetical protein [Vibrio mangrovi]MDW6003623.1 hypothetical protein [Vibrio mangrovi]
MGLVILVMLTSALWGCSSPYAPIHSQYLTTFKNENYQPLYHTGENAVLFMLHGMCYHGNGWATEHVNRIAATLDGVADQIDNGDSAFLFDEYLISREDYHLRVFALKSYNQVYPTEPWETDELKTASLNKSIKDSLVSDCLGDVVAYASPDYGPQLRKNLLSALNLAAQKVIHDYEIPDRVFFLSESLGSTMMRDVLVCEQPGDAFLQLAAKTETFFMSSNQLPLLNFLHSCQPDKSRAEMTGGAPQPVRKGILGLMDSVNQLRAARETSLRASGESPVITPLKVVAFSDPNDLLSYQIDVDSLGDESANVLSIPVSNSTTYFGWFANPLKVHTGYLENDSVLRLMSCGSEECH